MKMHCLAGVLAVTCVVTTDAPVGAAPAHRHLLAPTNVLPSRLEGHNE